MLFLVGAIGFGVAHRGMQALRAAGFVPRTVGESWGAVAEWEQWVRLSWIGLSLVAAGVAVGIVSAITHVRQRRSVARGDG